AVRESPASAQEESARHKVRRTAACPCWRPASFPFAWHWPATASAPPLSARFGQRCPAPEAGVFPSLHGWRGCSPASAFPCGALAAGSPDAVPAKQYACADNAGTAFAKPRQSSTELPQYPLSVFPHAGAQRCFTSPGPVLFACRYPCGPSTGGEPASECSAEACPCRMPADLLERP